MAQQTLEQFLRQKKLSAAVSRKKGTARKKAWLASLGKLMSTVRGWLRPLETEGVLSLAPDTRVLTESPVGTYEVPALTVAVGDEKVHFEPKGTIIVGATGRVDVIGEMGEETLILEGGIWKVVESRTPTRRLVPLTKESFHGVLAKVMRR